MLAVLGTPAFASAAGASAESLNLAGYRTTFAESFDTLDISAHGPGSRWIAHTPWNGDFGDAVFDDPGPAGPFSLSRNGLLITAHRDAGGRWHSGLICSVDRDGPGEQGFTQRYGYFEITAKLPDGPGVWPAFWLIGADKSHGSAEIDVFEYYGVSDRLFHSNEHFWVGGKDSLGLHKATSVPAGLLSKQFNTFGVLVTPHRTDFYLNSALIWSTPTPPEFDQPLYILADLALGGGWPITALSSPQIMTIRSIRVMQRDTP